MENKFAREDIIKALKTAPFIKEGELLDLHFSLSELEMLKGIKKLKALWVLTSYGRDYCYSFIADIDGAGNSEADDRVDAAIQGIAPHDMLYKLTCEVLGEEDNWFSGSEAILQKEIMEGRIRTLYLNQEWSDAK